MRVFSQDLAIAAASFKEAIAYRLSILVSAVTGPLIFFVNMIIWTAVFHSSGKQIIGGLTLEGMITYLAITNAGFYLIWNDVAQQIAERIRNGNLTAYLLKPIHYWRYEFARKIGHRTLAFFIEYVPVIIIIGIFFGFNIFKSNTWMFFAVSIILAIIMSFLVSALLGLIAFYTVRPYGFIRVYSMVAIFLTGGLLPLTIFPEWFQKISFYLPFQFIRYVPAKIFMGSYELAGITYTPLQIIGYGILQSVILFIIIIIAWRTAVKKFCGVGQ